VTGRVCWNHWGSGSGPSWPCAVGSGTDLGACWSAGGSLLDFCWHEFRIVAG